MKFGDYRSALPAFSTLMRSFNAGVAIVKREIILIIEYLSTAGMTIVMIWSFSYE
jgi:hypothetical protein